MEGKYYNFYPSGIVHANTDNADIDEILNMYIMPIDELQKKDYASTMFQTTSSPTAETDYTSAYSRESVHQSKNQIKLSTSPQKVSKKAKISIENKN